MELIDPILAGLRKTSAPEAVSVVFGLLYSILAVLRTRWCWVAGLISAGILVVLSWKAQLPMQACLQGYYVGMAFYGFWHWSREGGETKPVSIWPLRNHLISWVVIVVLSAGTSRYLASETQAAWPFLDSFVTWGSLLATWLTAQVKLENWLYWIALDAIAIFLYASQELMFVAMLFTAYLVISAFGFVTWFRSRRVPAPSG
ncbi:MAG: nicotinamide riboside transporter PnuC [Gammaproteobacteria bacterium]